MESRTACNCAFEANVLVTIMMNRTGWGNEVCLWYRLQCLPKRVASLTVVRVVGQENTLG